MTPRVAEVKALQKILNQSITLHLYGNDVIPAKGDTAATYTEITGGGYVAKSLLYANWSIVSGSPSRASYTHQDFTFTGPIDSPSTIYGYYMLDADGILFGSERFEETVIPFTPVVNSLIRVNPRYSAS